MRTALTLLMGSLLLLASCSNDQAVPGAEPAAPPAQAEHEDRLEAPEEGPAAQRAKALWGQTRPLVERDAKAGYSDSEYLSRRQPIWSAWTSLQMSVAGEDERVSRVIPKVLELINQVYGWPAFPAERRAEERRKAGRIERQIGELDRSIAEF